MCAPPIGPYQWRSSGGAHMFATGSQILCAMGQLFPTSEASVRAAAMGKNFIHQGEETADLATFEAAMRQKVKDEAFDADGYLLPCYQDQFHGVPPPTSSRFRTGGFVVRDGFVFRPKEVMNEGFSYLENQFRNYSKDFLYMLGRVRLMSTVRIQ